MADCNFYQRLISSFFAAAGTMKQRHCSLVLAAVFIVIFAAEWQTTEAAFDSTCPYQLPVNLWKGQFCGPVLTKTLLTACRLRTKRVKSSPSSHHQRHVLAKRSSNPTTTSATTSSSSELVVDLVQDNDNKQLKKLQPRNFAILDQRPLFLRQRSHGAVASSMFAESSSLGKAIIPSSKAHAILRSGGGGVHGGRGGGDSLRHLMSLLRSNSKWTPQNIICECCYNYCSMQELLDFCP